MTLVYVSAKKHLLRSFEGFVCTRWTEQKNVGALGVIIVERGNARVEGCKKGRKIANVRIKTARRGGDTVNVRMQQFFHGPGSFARVTKRETGRIEGILKAE